MPPPVERALQRLGHNIALARRRRRWTQKMLAERIGTTSRTVSRMEAGEPGIALHLLARALHVFNALEALDQLMASTQDTIGQLLTDETVPQRVRPPK
jgi:transcriptional regulator with XRE-family HTH domain